MKAFININEHFAPSMTENVNPVINSFHCYPMSCGRMSNKIVSSKWVLEYHSKNAGAAYIKSLSRQLIREKNTVHIYMPGSVYWEDTRGVDFPIQETFLYFSGAETCGIDKLLCPDLKFARFHDPDNVVGELFFSIAEFCSGLGGEAFWMAQGLFSEIIFHLIRAGKISGSEYMITAREEQRLSVFRHEVEQYLRRNLSRNIKLSDIASYMKISESLLSHRYKVETGISPIARLIELRIEFAKNLLMKGEKLKNIAEMAGFCDEYHLSKTFKSLTGQTPREFKAKSILA